MRMTKPYSQSELAALDREASRSGGFTATRKTRSQNLRRLQQDLDDAAAAEAAKRNSDAQEPEA